MSLKMKASPGITLQVIAGLLHFATPVLAQTQDLVARLASGNVVEIQDGTRARWEVLYRSNAWRTSQLSISPSGQLIALLEWQQGVIEGHDYATPPEPELIVLNRDGSLFRRVKRGAQKYAWCGPNTIAVISGSYREDGPIRFDPTGVSIIDLTQSSANQESPVEGVPEPIDVVFAPFDNALYVVNARPVNGAHVLRYELSTRALSPTQVIQPNFSSSGRHYLVRWPESDSVTVFNTATNQPVALPDVKAYGTIIRWGYDSGDFVLVHKRAGARQQQQPGRKPVVAATRPTAAREVDLLVYDVAQRRRHATLRVALDPSATAAGGVPVVTRAGRVETLRRP